ncbi:MAG: gluconeogenesis factor YvcK family protein [bacterium]
MFLRGTNESELGPLVEQLLEAVLNGAAPEGTHGSSVARLAHEVRAFEGRNTRVVTFGGGTGLSTVVGGNPQLEDWPDSPFMGLKQEFPLLQVVVCTTDDGGSTGLLLQQLPIIGVGDLRKSLVALILRENLQAAYGLDDAQAGRLVRVIHRIFNHRFPIGWSDFRPVANPLLVVPRELRRHCPEPLARLFRTLGGHVAPGGAGPTIRPGGHCLGNLILVASIFRSSGGTGKRPPGARAVEKGLEVLARAMGVKPGCLHPATPTPGQLVLRYRNGVAVRGQRKSGLSRRGFPIDRLSVEFCGNPAVSGRLCNMIREADLILFAPGSLYTSIMPIMQVPPIADAIRENRKALKILGANFWIQEGETDISARSGDRGFHVSELVEAYDQNVPGGAEGLFDVVLSANLEHIPGNVLCNYALEGKSPIYLDRDRVEALGLLPLEATVYSTERLRVASVIHHDPRKFASAVRVLLFAHQRLGLKRRPARAARRLMPAAASAFERAPALCSYRRAVGSLLAQKRFSPPGLRSTLEAMIWENRDIRPEHLELFRAVRVVPAGRWNRSKEWDNVLGYYDPEDGALKIHEQACRDPERLLDNLLIALGESLLGRYLESRRWIEEEAGAGWGARSYEIRLRPLRERQCYLDDASLRAYLTLARMVPSPHDRRTFRITLNDGEGFVPPGLLFGLLYAWYLNNAYGNIMEYEMSLLRWPPEKLIPCQLEERTRKQALVNFFRNAVFRHAGG